MLVLGGVSVGGAIFKLTLLNFDELYTCKVDDDDDFAAVKSIMASINSLESCKSKVPDAFKLIDKDGDGLISKCEDANFLHALGADAAYANTYSTDWTLAASYTWCETYF